MQRCTLTRSLAVALAVVTVAATGCLGSKDATDPDRGAEAKDVTLTIGRTRSPAARTRRKRTGSRTT